MRSGDTQLPRASDRSIVNLSVPIVFYQREENNLYVSSYHSHAHAVSPVGERDLPKLDGGGGGGGGSINTELKIILCITINFHDLFGHLIKLGDHHELSMYVCDHQVQPPSWQLCGKPQSS